MLRLPGDQPRMLADTTTAISSIVAKAEWGNKFCAHALLLPFYSGSVEIASILQPVRSHWNLSIPLNHDKRKWSAKAPPSGGDKHSPADGCGRGVFVVL